MNKEQTIEQQNKRDEFATKNDKILSEYHAEEIAIGILDDDLSDHYNEWIGTQSLEDLQRIEKCNACKAEKKYKGRSYLHTCGKSNKKL